MDPEPRKVSRAPQSHPGTGSCRSAYSRLCATQPYTPFHSQHFNSPIALLFSAYAFFFIYQLQGISFLNLRRTSLPSSYDLQLFYINVSPFPHRNEAASLFEALQSYSLESHILIQQSQKYAGPNLNFFVSIMELIANLLTRTP